MHGYIDKLIYLSAYMPVTTLPAAAYFATPEGMETKLSTAFLADPVAVGCQRIDSASTAAAYIQGLRTAFCADASDSEFAAIRHLMSPDDPSQPFGTPTGATAARWGSIKRSYIGCTQDNAITPALQKLFVSEADQLTPSNLTDFRTFNSSHSPFVSRPQDLADLIAQLAA